MRNQFTFYRSFWDACKDLPQRDRSAVLSAICAYALDGEELPLAGVSKAIFTLVKPTLDASARKAESGRIGGKAEAKPKQSVSKPQAKSEQTAREKEREKEIEIEIDKERKEKKEKFPPSIDDVIAYCKERGKGVDPERFYNYYSSNGWRVGKNPMKDWRAAVRTWERNVEPQTAGKSTSMRKYVEELKRQRE